MSSLFGALSASANSLQAFQRALDVTQNNVANASTPGYAAQKVTFEALPFAPDAGLPGGVTAADITSARSQYLDSSVQQAIAQLGNSEQQSQSLTAINGNFDISGQTGISKSLNDLFQSFSNLSVSPNDPTARNSVLLDAQNAAQSFQQAAAQLSQASTDTDRQIQTTVGQINQLAGQLQHYNLQRQQNPAASEGLDANVQNTLEQLSRLANITTNVASDGTTTVLLGGQTPLVIGSTQYSIGTGLAPAGATPKYPNGTPAAEIQDQDGRDITSEVTGGKLAGLLQVRNSVLPSLRGDTSQPGQINQLAKAFAARVNTLLTSGNISDGPPPQPGIPLFTYDTTDDTNVAQTLAVNPAISATTVATIDPGPPYASNGTAVKLAALAHPSQSADEINGLSFTAFYGQIASGVGQQLASANNNQDLQQQTVTQARNLRSQVSGVSLDQEAVNLTEFQNAYQATAKLITVLDSLTQAAINILR